MLQDFPLQLVNIVLIVIHDDGGLLSALINASMAALIAAGIPMKTTALAINLLLGEEICLDPTAEETEKGFVTTYVIDAISQRKLLVNSISGGGASLAQLVLCEEVACRAVAVILERLRTVLTTKLQAISKTLITNSGLIE